MRVQPSHLRKLSRGFRFFTTQQQIKQVPCIVNGAEVFTEVTKDSIGPYTGEVISRVSYATQEVVNQAAQAASDAQKEWSQVPFEERIKVVEAVIPEMEKRKSQLIEALMVDGGGSAMKAGMEAMIV